MYDGPVRVGVFATLALAPSVAIAEPHLEASGYIGVAWFGEDNQLGNSWAPEQVPQTAPLFGGRLTWLFLPDFAIGGDGAVQLGVEAEVDVATSSTGTLGGRMSYFAPVFGWRGQAIARVRASEWIIPFLVAGVGGETVASSSPFMSKETDPLFYWGPGAALPFTDRWNIRLDLRHGLMAARDDSAMSTIWLQLGVSGQFGLPRRKVKRERRDDDVAIAAPVDKEQDTDGDGLPDHVDSCPAERENVDGNADADGCPEPDADFDGFIGNLDRCPQQPEDVDGFQDDDGCAEADNDTDGLADIADTCPLEAETPNGFTDTDGCPDELPAIVTRALADAGAIAFEAKRARVTAAAKTTLRQLASALRTHADLRIVITGHPAAAGDDDLAKRRAEAVKWYLIDQGIAQDRIATAIGAVAPRPLALSLAPTPPAASP